MSAQPPVWVAHRRNTRAALDATDPAHGVEVDVRWRDGRLICAHDPGEDGEPFETWLRSWRHALLVVNTKEEGIVARALAAVDAAGVRAAFALGPDPGEAWPLWQAGERRVAVRVSELHPLQMALGLRRWIDWVWVDGFLGFPLDATSGAALAASGLQACFVSPELYGRPSAEIPAFRAAWAASGAPTDALCTRELAAWGAQPAPREVGGPAGTRNTQ